MDLKDDDDLRDAALDDDDGLHDDLVEALGTAGDGDDKSGDDGDDLHGDLKAEFDGQREAAEGDAAWQRELRKSADEMLKRHGIDPKERHAQGLSRREVARRLFSAEQQLASDPRAALPKLIGDYGRALAGTPAAVETLREIAARLGVDPSGLPERERAELAEHRAAVEQKRINFNNELVRQAVVLADFKQKVGLDEFSRYERAVHELLRSEEAHTLESAFRLAKERDPHHQAQLAAQQRREHFYRATKARTPKSASASGSAPSDQSLRDDLKDELRAQLAR